MESRWRWLAPIGVALAAAAFLVEGPGLLGHTADHVVRDLTVELWPHVLLLGVALVAYAGLREALARRG